MWFVLQSVFVLLSDYPAKDTRTKIKLSCVLPSWLQSSLPHRIKVCDKRLNLVFTLLQREDVLYSFHYDRSVTKTIRFCVIRHFQIGAISANILLFFANLLWNKFHLFPTAVMLSMFLWIAHNVNVYVQEMCTTYWSFLLLDLCQHYTFSI